jgi:hypothetical protein
MPVDIRPPRLRLKEDVRDTPQELIFQIFRHPEFALPIRGGWGYSREDAVQIDMRNPVLNKKLFRNAVDVEYAFVRSRVLIELISSRRKEDQHSGIEWELLSQSTSTIDGRQFDRLTFQVTAFPDAAWEKLKAEWEGPKGVDSPTFDRDVHLRKRDQLQIRYDTEFWFDISQPMNSLTSRIRSIIGVDA